MFIKIIKIGKRSTKSKLWNFITKSTPKDIKTWHTLDLFMGSGTTGYVDKKFNRHFVCVEKEKKYFDIVQARIGYA